MKLTSRISVSEEVPNLHFLVFDNLIDFNTCWFYCISPLYITTASPLTSLLLWSERDLLRKEENLWTSLHPSASSLWPFPKHYSSSSSRGPPRPSLHCCTHWRSSCSCLSFTLLEVVLREYSQEKVEILLPLTHGIYIPEQHFSVVHYWKGCQFRTCWSKRAQLKESRNKLSTK